MIPFSGVSKSGASSIIHAGGTGRSVHWTSGGDLQPLTAENNITLKLINIFLGISQLLRVFRSDVALTRMHVVDDSVCQIERMLYLVRFFLFFSGVVKLFAEGLPAGFIPAATIDAWLFHIHSPDPQMKDSLLCAYQAQKMRI